MSAPVFRDHGHAGSRNAENLAACALVAGKVYEAFGWVRFGGWDGSGREGFHVPDAEALMPVLLDLGRRALDDMEKEHTETVGKLRFLAWADDDGPDSSVDFFITVGSAPTSDFGGQP